MTGFRVGWMVTPNLELSNAAAKLLEASVSCGVPFAQQGALAALECPETTESVTRMVAEYHSRRDAAVAVLKKHGLYEYSPEGAFYLLVRIHADDHAGPALDDVQFCKDLLEEEHVAVSPGSAFGDVSDGFVRVSLARDVADVVEGLERLCRRIARVRADT